MIDQTTRTQLRSQTKKGDIKRAAQIYEQKTGCKINPSQLQKLLTGHLQYQQGNIRKHQPLQMFNAITQAIQERQTAEQKATTEANKLLQQILRDTKPTQPIPL